MGNLLTEKLICKGKLMAKRKTASSFQQAQPGAPCAVRVPRSFGRRNFAASRLPKAP